jgi:hypothetical protein
MPNQTNDSETRAIPTGSGYSTTAIICGVWFLLTGWMWTFLFNLVIAYPIGICGLYMWMQARQLNPNDKKNSIAIGLLGLGLASSLAALLLYK